MTKQETLFPEKSQGYRYVKPQIEIHVFNDTLSEIISTSGEFDIDDDEDVDSADK